MVSMPLDKGYIWDSIQCALYKYCILAEFLHAVCLFLKTTDLNEPNDSLSVGAG